MSWLLPSREIGLLQAVGPTTGDILLQFLIEAVALSLLGGIGGTASVFSRQFDFSACPSMASIWNYIPENLL